MNIINSLLKSVNDTFIHSKYVKYIIYINIISYIITLLYPDFIYSNLALYNINNVDFHYYQIITHMFIHGGFLHLLMNMFVLYQFGILLESKFGSNKFIILYIFSGLISVLFSVLLSNSNLPSVGASGCVFGVVTSIALLRPNMSVNLFLIPIPIKLYKIVSFYLLFEFILALLNYNDGIGHWAHIGGALGGAIIFIFYIKGRRIKQIEYLKNKFTNEEDYIEVKSVANRILGYNTDIADNKESYINVFSDYRDIFIDINIYTHKGNLIWSGDIEYVDVYLNKLKKISNMLNTAIYISNDSRYKNNYIFKVKGNYIKINDNEYNDKKSK